MNSALAESLAPLLESALRHRSLGRPCRPDRWSLGLELPGGVTLGLCWHPQAYAVGLCDWRWPRGRPEDVLAGRLKGGWVESVRAVAGEPIIRFDLGGNAGGALVWEALGRSANALLLDTAGQVLWSGRLLDGDFRTGRTGQEWRPPPHREARRSQGQPDDPEEYLRIGGPEKLRRGLAERGRRALLASLDSKRSALRRRLEAVSRDREEGRSWAALEGAASSLIATADLGRRGERERTVTDYTLDPPAEVALTLDPARTVRENALALFKKVQRGKARLQKTTALLAELEREVGRIEAEREAAGECEDLGRLYPDAGAPRAGRAVQPRRTVPPGVAHVPLPLDYAGFAGKTASGNDWVSFRIGRGSDFWFHAADYPGCHVVVKNPRRLEALPYAVEQAAVAYAAAHSQAPPGNRVGVSVAFCKSLRRVPGAPGRVMVAAARTVLVDLPMGR